MKRKVLLTLALTAISSLCFGVGAACSDEPTANPVGEAYDWTFDKPQAGTPDEYMTMDGKLDEDVWKTKKTLSQTVKGVSWSATTHFSEKGLYIGVKATDDTMTYKTRFTSRSSFSIYICKTGTQTYHIQSTAYHPSRTYIFQLDPYYCRSKSRVPYYYEAYVDGELNSETTCTMTAELFLTWEDLYYTADELGENGYPEDVQMYVNYEGEKSEVLGSCLWREETYFEYDKDGYKGDIDHEKYGSVENALAATDRWEINDQGNPQTTAGRTQILWLKDAYAKDFVFEAELTPLGKDKEGKDISLRGERVSGRIGLINENSNGNYSIFSADARKIGSKELQLQTCRQIDSFHWQNQIGLSKVVRKDYDKSSVIFRIIKQGDMFYYFYGDSYWGCERIPDLQDEVYCGFYTSQGMVVENCEFEDYTGKSEQLKNALSQYVYFVEVAGEMTYGSVSTSAYAVGQGEEVTISFLPKSKSVLTQITQKDEEGEKDVYEDILAAMNEKCEYTFTPTGDVSFDAVFTPFENKDLVKTVIVFRDTEGAQVKNANYEIVGSNKLLFYKGTPNSSGYIIVQIPKAGTYSVDGREFVVDGNYQLYSSFTSYRDANSNFTLTDETTSVDINGKEESVKDTKSYTHVCTIVEHSYASTVSVNNNEISSSTKNIRFDESTQNYYAIGQATAYMKDYVNETYLLKAKVMMSGMTGDVQNAVNINKDPIAGIIINNGGNFIEVKTNYANSGWGGQLIITTANGDKNSEIAIKGFDSAVRNSGKEMDVFINVARYQDKIYLLNNAGEIKLVLSKEGIELRGGASVAWGGENEKAINENLVRFFSATRKKNAVGMLCWQGSESRVEWAFTSYESDDAKVKDALGYGELIFNADTAEYTATNVAGNYTRGEQILLEVTAKNETRKAAKLQITYADGTETLEGEYDVQTGKATFAFAFVKGCTVTVVMEELHLVNVAGKLLAPKSADFVNGALYVDGKKYENKISADGSFSLRLEGGTYELKAALSGYVLYKTIELEEDCELGELQMVADTYDVGGYGAMSDDMLKGITSFDVESGSYTVTGSTYWLAMPNTATTGNYIFRYQTTGISYAGAEGESGALVATKTSDGKTLLLTVTIRQYGVITVNVRQAGGLDATVSYQSTVTAFHGNYTMTITRTADSIVFYNEAKDEKITVSATGVELKVGDTVCPYTSWSSAMSTAMTDRLAKFFETDAEHAVGFGVFGSSTASTLTYNVLEFTSDEAYALTGRVLLNGAPVSGVSVFVGDSVVATTDENGEYSIRLTAGSYRLTFQKGNYKASLYVDVLRGVRLVDVTLKDSEGVCEWLWGEDGFTENRENTFID